MSRESDLFSYEIPDDIKRRIPDYFYLAFGGECVSVLGSDIFVKHEDGLCALDFFGGTSGYVQALRMTCKKLDMEWLFDYWKGLSWDQSDMFDGKLIDEVLSVFSDKNRSNDYYQYLLNHSSPD